MITTNLRALRRQRWLDHALSKPPCGSDLQIANADASTYGNASAAQYVFRDLEVAPTGQGIKALAGAMP
jgi:hypothetical protein